MNDEQPIELRAENPAESGDEILIEVGEVSELTLGDIGMPLELFIVNRLNA